MSNNDITLVNLTKEEYEEIAIYLGNHFGIELQPWQCELQDDGPNEDDDVEQSNEVMSDLNRKIQDVTNKFAREFIKEFESGEPGKIYGISNIISDKYSEPISIEYSPGDIIVSEIDDLIFTPNAIYRKAKCECGAHKVNDVMHSDWCPMYNEGDK